MAAQVLHEQEPRPDQEVLTEQLGGLVGHAEHKNGSTYPCDGPPSARVARRKTEARQRGRDWPAAEDVVHKPLDRPWLEKLKQSGEHEDRHADDRVSTCRSPIRVQMLQHRYPSALG